MTMKIYGFIFVMWILIIIGGGIVVEFVGPISLSEDIEPMITSGIKVVLALFLIFIWIFTLTKIKNWIFKSQAKSQVQIFFHSACFLSYSLREYFGFAGTPITTVSGGTSLVTTAPIPITLFLPIVTPALITARLPIIALS